MSKWMKMRVSNIRFQSKKAPCKKCIYLIWLERLLMQQWRFSMFKYKLSTRYCIAFNIQVKFK